MEFVTVITAIDAVQKAITKTIELTLDDLREIVAGHSMMRFRCVTDRCTVSGRPEMMRNIARKTTHGAIAPVCRSCARGFEAEGVRTFNLRDTLVHAAADLQRQRRSHGLFPIGETEAGRRLAAARDAMLNAWRQVPATTVESELLPPGDWPVERNGNGCSKPHAGPALDLGRLAFLAGLGDVKMVIFAGLKSSFRNYTGFVFTTPTGRKLALVDADMTGNGLYVFDARTDGWIEAAMRTKRELLATNPHPAFIRRVYHHDGWQDRVRSLIAA